jgi:hypothetical protein
MHDESALPEARFQTIEQYDHHIDELNRYLDVVDGLMSGCPHCMPPDQDTVIHEEEYTNDQENVSSQQQA